MEDSYYTPPSLLEKGREAAFPLPRGPPERRNQPRLHLSSLDKEITLLYLPLKREEDKNDN